MQILDQLKQFMAAVASFSESEWKQFAAIWEPFSAKRKEILTEAGQHEKYLYFVSEGVQRVYYFDEDDREATLVFTYPPSFGGVLDSGMLSRPSRYYYETLSPSLFLRTPFEEFKSLAEKTPHINQIVTTGLSQTISGLLERLAELQCYTSEEKFRSLLKRSPHILQLVPHKYLANYIGIDPTNFSKLINKVML